MLKQLVETFEKFAKIQFFDGESYIGSLGVNTQVMDFVKSLNVIESSLKAMATLIAKDEQRIQSLSEASVPNDLLITRYQKNIAQIKPLYETAQKNFSEYRQSLLNQFYLQKAEYTVGLIADFNLIGSTKSKVPSLQQLSKNKPSSVINNMLEPLHQKDLHNLMEIDDQLLDDNKQNTVQLFSAK